MRITLNDRHVPMRMVARVQPVALLKWLKAAASVITVFTPSGGFRGRIRENGEKALIGSLPYRAGKATEDIASFRHHPLHGVRGRGNVVDKANSLSGQPGHLLPIAHCVLGRQNYVEFAQHHVLAEEASAADLGQIVAPRRHLAQAVVPFFDDAIAYDAHRIEVRPFGTKDRGVNGLPSAGGDDAALVLGVHG